MNRIFISYSSKNADWLRNRLVSKLEIHCMPAHVDYRDLEIGVPSLNEDAAGAVSEDGKTKRGDCGER